jgi:transposase InsO family protein
MLSKAERDNILVTVNSEDFKSLPPNHIVPKLADDGVYLPCESTDYRVLHEEKLQNARGRSQIKERKAPTTHCATGPNQVWCWDITWLPAPAKGLHFYLYLILDIFIRKIVGWEIHDE